MLTPILKTRTFIGFVLAYAICTVLLVVSFLFQSTSGVQAEMLLSHWAFGWIENQQIFLTVLSLALIVLVAVVSRLRPGETKQPFGSSNVSMIVMSAVLLTQSNSVFARPDVVAAAAVIMAMFLLLFSTYKKEATLTEVFHVGLLLGLSSLFVGQTIFLALPIGFSVLLLRSGSWKEWIVLFLGVLLCSVFLLMFTIWNDAPLLEFKRVIQSAWTDNFGQAKANSGHIVLLVGLLAAVSGIFGSLTVGTVTERNITLTNLSWLIGVILMVILLGLGWQNGLILAAFPLSISITRTIERIQRWWLADLVLLAILVAPIVRILWRL